MRISARNTLKGKITAVEIGAVNAEVTIDIGNGTHITAIITKHSAENLKLKVGDEAYALVKASDVMIGVD